MSGSREERCRGDFGARREEDETSAASEREVRGREGKWLELFNEVVAPVVVVVLGVGFSLAALWVSLSAALWPAPSD